MKRVVEHDAVLCGLDEGGADSCCPGCAAEARKRQAGRNGHARRAESGKAEDGSKTAAEIILQFFRDRYRPKFRRGNAVITHEGETVPQSVACSVPTSALIQALGGASDAPRFAGRDGRQGEVKTASLPKLFSTWARVAWGDLLSELPDEDAADLGPGSPPAEEFRRLVREAMFTDVVLGTVIRGERHEEVTQTERRSLIGWCQKLAKPGPWRDIRSKRCWCRLREHPGAELELQVAIRHELLAQLHADARLRALGANRFTRLCAKYRVGESRRADRPHGQSAVVLHAEFVADLIADLPEGAETAPAEGVSGTEGDLARARDNEFPARESGQKAKVSQDHKPPRDPDGEGARENGPPAGEENESFGPAKSSGKDNDSYENAANLFRHGEGSP